MREFFLPRINMAAKQSVEVTFPDKSETRYYVEIDVVEHIDSPQTLTQEVYWIIEGQEIFHRRLTRKGGVGINKAGLVDTKCAFGGDIDPLATGVKVYIDCNRRLMASATVRVT